MRSGIRSRGGLLALLLALCAAPATAPANVLDIHHDSTAIGEVGTSDGIISPGDQLSVVETLFSSDPIGDITNLNGTLTTSTANVTVPQGRSAFPTLSFASTAANSTPFAVQVGAGLECGQNIDLSLGLSADQGSANVPFQIGTGMAAAPSDFASADVPHGIPDASVMTSSLPIATNGRVKQIAVHLGQITHSYDGDLRITLIAPDGTRVVLVDQRGGMGQNFTNTWITADQGAPVGGGTAPFTGTYVADGDLSQMIGRQEQGTWKLEIRDLSAGNVGTLQSWGLQISAATCAAQPIASFSTTPSPALPGDTVQFDASGSQDPAGTIVDYQWDFDADGTYDASGVSASHAFTTRGAYPVSLKVTDDNGLVNVYTRTVSVTNPPTAVLTATPTDPLTGDNVSLNADGSTDPDGPIVDYKWDLNGDGVFEADTGADPLNQVTFSTPGTHTVGLMVTDTDGGTNATSVAVNAVNRPPVAQIANPGLGIVGQQLTLDATGSSDPDGTIVDYAWDLDNNGSYETDAGPFPTLAHTFNSAGTKTVGLQVTDSNGASTPTTVSFKVTTLPNAVLTATPNPARPRQTVALDAGGSSDPDGGAVTFKWDLDGNGTYETDTGSTSTASVSWSTTGSRTVRVKVTDPDGAFAVATAVIAVVNKLPVPNVAVDGGPATAGAPVTLDASGSSDPDGTIVRYEWDLDGNGSFETDTGATATVTRTYPNAGTIPVKVRLTDNDGGVAVGSLSLVVETSGGTGGTGTTGGTTGTTGGSSGTGGSGGGTTPPAVFAADLAGSPMQAIKLARRRGPTLICTSDQAIRCTVTATISAGVAKKLRLTRARKAATVGRAVVDVAAGGNGHFVLELTKKARKALRRIRRVRLVIKGTAVDADGHSVRLARVVLLR